MVIYLPSPWSKGQHPSWEANSHSIGQEIPCLVCNWKFHDHVHLELSTVNTIMIHSSIILAYSPRYPMWSLPFKISTKVPLSHISYLWHCCLILPSLHLVKLTYTPIIFTWEGSRGAGPEAIHKIHVGKKCSCAVCVVSPRKFGTNNLSVFYIVTYIVNHIFEA
jgi:hypothetical protein